jgi:hypothetical protein
MLKLRLYRINEIIIIKILEQSEGTKALIGDNLHYIDADIEVKSVDHPDLRKSDGKYILYLRGTDKTDDKRTIAYRCKDIEEAQELIKIIQRAVSEINIEYKKDSDDRIESYIIE